MMNKSISIIASVILSFALFFAYTNSGAVFAQNQSSNKTSPQNQTLATITGKSQTMTINKTSIPAEQTTVTVNQTTAAVNDQAKLQPLANQTIQQQLPSLSGVKNQTTVQSTGPATTTIINQTTIPFTQTTMGVENSTTSSQPQQNQTGQSQPQTPQPQQNQSKGPLEQLSSTVGNLLGGKK
ncbi:MAG: hypothetical protein M3Z01_04205 [Thermoproteota archaeon]|nr:hypothetical protein [Thermoproteota archaeon]